ncbi:MAG: winged helix-turn-helix domain-containing protein [Anaerolineae bacterium]|nr:winged helix-turn-helix domain-containing protein [Anaerolineae bacterium]
MPQLAISTLGSLRVTFDGRLVDSFGTDKARALLVYLAVEGGRPHSRETLAGLLWPESSEPNARHSLSQVLSNLRSLFGDRAAAAEGRPPYLDATRWRGGCMVWRAAPCTRAGSKPRYGLPRRA